MPLASFLLAGLLAQAAATAQFNPAALGPPIGQEVPDFTAIDQDGRERTLGSLMGPRGLMLVFFRSADW